MKRLRVALLVVLLVLSCLFIMSCAGASGDKAINNDSVYQASILDAVNKGLYDGFVTMGELKEKGDFGIGTFDRLEGEMILLDGTIYQVKTDGSASVPPAKETSPFAVVTFFDSDSSSVVSDISSIQSLQQAVDRLLPTKNVIYAIKIPGEFEYIKTRSVPGQKKPYPPLAEVVKIQSTFEFQDVKGTIVGFRYPNYMAGINLSGYHLHFMTGDNKSGGHLLECRFKSATVQLDECLGVDLELPRNKAFFNAEFNAGKIEGE